MLRRSALSQRPAAELDIEVGDDRLSLSETSNVFSDAALPPGRSGGVWSMHMPREQVGERDLRKRLKGHTAGKPRPHWHDGLGGALRLETYVMRVRNVDHMPAYGAVIDSDGRVFRRTAAEAPELSLSPRSPTVSQDEATAPGDDQQPAAIRSATVFVPWGARFNYSHFVLDALAGLAVIDDLNGLESHPPIAPPLTGWQRQLLDLYLGDRAGLVREIEDEVVHIDDAVFTNCMDHFLHAPNNVLRRVRERILTSAHRQVAHPQTPRLLYLVRADQTRMMVNQDKLVDLMRKRGFAIIQPDGLTPAEQVLLFSKAEVIVSATGAGLTNVLFAPKGCKVFEIQPGDFTSVWVRQICDLIGVKWFGYFCPPPQPVKESSARGKLRSDLLFQYRLPLDPFVAFLRSQAEL